MARIEKFETWDAWWKEQFNWAKRGTPTDEAHNLIDSARINACQTLAADAPKAAFDAFALESLECVVAHYSGPHQEAVAKWFKKRGLTW